MKTDAERMAAQLRCPHGREGKALGQAMNLRNLVPITSMIAALCLRDKDRILEIGHGNGGMAGYILSQARSLHYTGLETSPLMHAEASAFNAAFVDAGLANYRLHRGGALPFPEQQFDVVFSVNTVYFWHNPTRTLADIARVLKAGGRLGLNFCEKAFMRRQPFAEHGFVLYDAEDIEELAFRMPFQLIRKTRSQDWTISKSGELAQREFVDLVFEKMPV